MADEYIKREDAERCAEKIINHPIEDGFRDSIEILSAIHNLPAADVRPVVHGRWEREEDTYFGFTDVEHRCSQCGKTYSRQGFCAFHFCPNCGADMCGDETSIL